MSAYTINCAGRLISLDVPHVMGIINITPDSFYAQSRKQTAEDIAAQARRILAEGGTMIDVGAYSSRPGAADVSPQEEMERLAFALPIIREAAPGAIISVDTFRADVAKMSVEEHGADIVNDISGGELDRRMFRTVSQLRVPYILMHMRGTPQSMQTEVAYEDLLRDMFVYFSRRINALHELGVSDVIVDPGFGFAKTLEQNYEVLAHLEEFAELGEPLLVGVSRKSMISRLLGTSAEEALGGTTVVNTLALAKGAHILRVHDVRPAVEAVKIVQAMRSAHEIETIGNRQQ